MKEYRRILEYLRPYIWPRGVLAVVFMLVFSGLESGIPFLIKYAFDEVFKNQSVAALNWIVVLIGLVSLARGFLGMGAVYWSDWIGQRVVTDIRQQLIEHFQRMERSCRILCLGLPGDADALSEITLELLRLNRPRTDTYIRPLAFKAARSIKVALSGLRDGFGMFTFPLGDYPPTNGLAAPTAT